MPKYMLLLYADQPDEAEVQRREAAFPRWVELTQSLDEAGIRVAGDRLADVDVATTLRVRDGETEIVDGPFATTKEILGGYYILECGDLDEALKWAARAPIAEWGSVEVRPIVENPLDPANRPAAAQQAG